MNWVELARLWLVAGLIAWAGWSLLLKRVVKLGVGEQLVLLLASLVLAPAMLFALFVALIDELLTRLLE